VIHAIGRHYLIHGDSLEVLPTFEADSVDAIVSDPPYGLGFMGNAWDQSVPCQRMASELFRVLKPGGHALLFGGTRTYHRLAVALEDAGFEIRDCLSWLYGTGFPKSLDVSKAIDDVEAARQWEGWGTALKPAWEPILLTRKPLIGTVAENVQAHGTGGINVDACRIDGESTVRMNSPPVGYSDNNVSTNYQTGSNLGRWPANVVLDEEAAAILDEQSGDLGKSTGTSAGTPGRPGILGRVAGDKRATGKNDSGGASRFFYVAKPSRAERDRGCDALPVRSGGEATDREDDSPGTQSPRAGSGRTGGARNIHPTVKPAALIAWLLKLVTLPGGVVLDPYCGSGTIYLAAEGLDLSVVGIERDPDYVEIALARGATAV
jgi:site-specific DNA-methyltransferase (adenine-specific)